MKRTRSFFCSSLFWFLFMTYTPSTPSPTPSPTPFITTSTVHPSPVGQIWALLVAGSNEFSNYRHQADICHAYQILHANNIPDENIIVMMFDDIAYNNDNPFNGTIINKPGGKNVYKNVLKDYTGKDVNVKNFLNILKGDKDAMKGIGSGKVIESGPNDHLFVNFVDHGSPGALMFPNGELLADKLNEVLKQIATENKFSKMVFYVEACYSGSMFENLLSDDLNIFVETAADARESSYACYFDDAIGVYIGDCYSVSWMEDTEKEVLTKETLNKQFAIVRAETKQSHVEEYGELNLGSTKMDEVFGLNGKTSGKISRNFERYVNYSDAVASQDVPLYTLKNKLVKTKNKYERMEIKMKINELKQKRRAIDQLFDKIVSNAAGSDSTRIDMINNFIGQLTEDNFPCYRSLFTYFSENCLRIHKNPYVAHHLLKFVNFCSLPWTREATMIDAMNNECQELNVNEFRVFNVV